SLNVDVTVFMQEKARGPDGSERNTVINDHSMKTITAKGNSDVTGQHGAKAGPGGSNEVDTIHVTDKEKSTISNRSGDTRSVQISSTKPVTNGNLTTVEIGKTEASDNTSDTEENDGSDDSQGPVANLAQSTLSTTTGSKNTESEDFSDTVGSTA